MPERMLRLLSLLQSRRAWSGADLARRLEVTDRTVRRDIERLRGLGYPVDASTGVAGGYRLVSGADLPPLLLEDDEAVAIAVGLRTASAGLEDAAVRALAKLEQILPKRLRGKVNAVGDATSALPQRGAVDISVLGVVAAACRDHELLRFDYSGRDGRPAARRVEPRNLVAWYGRWYLIAFDTDRADWRTFRLDRLADPVRLGHRAPPRELPAADPAAFLVRSLRSAPFRFTAVATVSAPADVVAGRLFAPLPGKITALGKSRCVVRFGADDPNVIAGELVALGADFTLEVDPDLLAHLEKAARRLTSKPAGFAT